MTKEIFVLAAGYFNSRTGRYERYQEVIAPYREMSHFATIFDCRNDANHELPGLLDYQILALILY